MREVEAALLDAARRLEAAGWTVEAVEDTPPMHEATELNMHLWLGDGFAGMAARAAEEGDPAAIAILEYNRAGAEALAPDAIPQALVRRAGLVREWSVFLDRYSVLPVSAELPFADDLDQQGPAAMARVWAAQLTQTALPLLGLPGLSVATGMAGDAPVGVQLIAGRYREDLLLLAGEAIEAGGVPAAPVDPVSAER